MSDIVFKPRWREELEVISAEGKLVFEFTIGEQHVYFPDEARWLAVVPPWARDRWSVYAEACKQWCAQTRIPITFVPDAHVHAEA